MQGFTSTPNPKLSHKKHIKKSKITVKNNPSRLEKDAIGSIHVPKNAYYGAFTTRALHHFQVSGMTAPQEFKQAVGYIKKAAAQTNKELKELEPREADAIITAAEEFINGKFDNEYVLDVFQAGAGTPFNMNANEIIANRANELLGQPKGKYQPITPNNHVNWSQSSNDVIPTAIRIAALFKMKELSAQVEKLSQSFFHKAKTFEHILKIGRTHLQDAVPITLGQEFEAYGAAFERSYNLIQESFAKLNEIGLGGTALGTGITTHPQFRKQVVKNLAELTGLPLSPTPYPMELTNNMNSFVVASNSLRCLANDLIRISSDLRLLTSGPVGGINEIILPEIEPGSSIMPGKINPSIPECVAMGGFQVLGNDHALNLGVQAGQLELNIMTPLILFNLLWSLELLTNICKLFAEECVQGIEANALQCEKLLQSSLCIATGLSPYLGYKATAELVKEALQTQIPLQQVVKNKNFMADKELRKILSPSHLTGPTNIDHKLKTKIIRNKNYQKYLKEITSFHRIK